ncbi:hypothetical protein NW757_006949 [Fusarium falciforme]|nr:hypothetical protein NW757_006949 [Fusarium falciforme]
MNLNLSASLNITRLFFKPSLCLPHHTVSTFNDLPIPLEKGLQKDGRKVEIKAVVLDKDDCFAYPDSIEVYGPYQTHFEKLRQAYPGRKLLVVSNTAGATSWDKNMKLASEANNGYDARKYDWGLGVLGERRGDPFREEKHFFEG